MSLPKKGYILYLMNMHNMMESSTTAVEQSPSVPQVRLGQMQQP